MGMLAGIQAVWSSDSQADIRPADEAEWKSRLRAPARLGVVARNAVEKYRRV